MRRWVSALAVLAVAGGALGGLVAWSGIINVGASTGHWKVTEWLLHGAMRQSVEFRADDTAVPPLDDPALVRRGAGHYAQACAPCHGAPGVDRSAVAREMTPHPPFLPDRIAEWREEELFWIVRHGVKFTAMPAWPAMQRKDEVWSMVAFLRRLPAMDSAQYRRLAYGSGTGASSPDLGQAHDPEISRHLGRCAACHGHDGAGNASFPRLSGQSEEYLFASLKAFADRTRFSGFMQAAVYGLDERAMQGLARHYAAAEPGASAGGAPAADAAALGERLARYGDPAGGVPACASCHGLAAGPRFGAYPLLAGQQAWYLATQLRLLRNGERGGTAYAHIMRTVARRLSDDQISAVAAYYASLVARRPQAHR